MIFVTKIKKKLRKIDKSGFWVNLDIDRHVLSLECLINDTLDAQILNSTSRFKALCHLLASNWPGKYKNSSWLISNAWKYIYDNLVSVLMCGMPWLLCTVVSPNSWDHSDRLTPTRKLHVVTSKFLHSL